MISVIITNYNYEKYIGEAIQSVKNQTYTNWELIIVDDGSMDNSKKVIEENIKSIRNKVKVIYKKNGGQASGFNIGVENATGDIIAFLDADDYWYSNKLEIIAKYHEHHDGVQHNLLINDTNKYSFLEDNVSKQKEMMDKYGFIGNIPTSAMSFKKYVIDKFFPIPEEDYKICADTYVRAMSLLYTDMISIDTPLGCYRVHGENNWYKEKSIGIEYMEKVFLKINEIRKDSGFLPILRESIAEAYANIFIDSFNLDKAKQYIIFGNGALGKALYKLLLSRDFQINGFSNSFFAGENEKFLDTTLFNIQYLKSNPSRYDEIIIASDQMVEIYTFLKDLGFEDSIILTPRL